MNPGDFDDNDDDDDDATDGETRLNSFFLFLDDE